MSAIIFFALCLFPFSSLFGSPKFLNPEGRLRRIHSHLLIRDYQSALEECKEGLLVYPKSEALKRAYVCALAEGGKEGEAISRWEGWGEKEVDRDILEILAWGVLHRFEDAYQLDMSIASLLGAFYTQDVRSVQMLKNYMGSSDAFLRATAVQLASYHRDEILIEQVKRLFESEKVLYVRLEVIKAVGLMRVCEMKGSLKKILVDPYSRAEEKACAVKALVDLYEKIAPEELLELIQSNRSDLRHLACQLIAHLDLLDQIPTLFLLLKDPVPSVRVASLTSLYLLGLKNMSRQSLLQIKEMIEDPYPALSIMASWISLSFAEEKALKTLKRWVDTPDCDFRNLAAFAIGNGTVERASLLAQEVIRTSKDPFVKVNAALGLMHKQAKSDLAASTLYQFLMTHKERVMWKEEALFQVLAPSLAHHIPQIPQYPTLIDQLARLDVLNFLAILDYPKGKEAIRAFIKHQVFGVSYAALMSFIREGGEEALSILRQLLKDKDQAVGIRAALALALFCKDSEAIEVLEQVYSSVDRETKVNILEAIGHIGNQKSVPFLFKLLKEPHYALRVRAASALIQCLYH